MNRARQIILVGALALAATAIATVPAHAAPPPFSVGASFSPAQIPVGQTTQLNLSVQTAENGPAVDVTFTDTLPTGLTVSTGTTSPVCGIGTLTTTAPSTVSFSASFPADQAWTCPIAVTVTGATAGAYAYTGASFESSLGNAAPPEADLVVVAPPAIAKAFGADSIALGDSTSLTYTITNPNSAAALTGIAFADHLPGGLVVATPNGVVGGCGGTVSAAPASGTISLSAGSLAAGGSCQFTVSVTGAAQGIWLSETGAITSTEGGTGGTASAQLVVAVNPTLAASFAPAAIPLNGSSTLTFSLYNPETSGEDVTLLNFAATLPAGLTTPDATTSACGGTLTVTAGAISFTSGSLEIGWSCQFSVTVTGTAGGTFTLQTSTLGSSSGMAAPGASTTLTVNAPTPRPTVTPPPTSMARPADSRDPELPVWLLLGAAAACAALAVRAGAIARNARPR